MKIKKGQVIIYRLYDVGEEILLKPAYLSLNLEKKDRAKLKPKTFLVKDPPIQFDLGPGLIKLNSGDVACQIEAKFWNYGVISMQLIIDINDIDTKDLGKLGMELDTSRAVDDLARNKMEAIFDNIKPHIIHAKIWDTFEDYNLFFFTEIEGVAKDLLCSDIANLLLIDNENLSESTQKDVLSRYYQYSEKDLTMINWNSAVVLDQTGSKEIPDIIEFALTHLLEMRFYDELLDDQLNDLYTKMNGKVFTNIFYNMSKKSSRQYIEFSEFLDRVENSIKTVGDSYLAFIFRTANKEFRVEQWQTGIKGKMDDLYRIPTMLQGEINHTRGMIMESIVVMWAIYEVFFKH